MVFSLAEKVEALGLSEIDTNPMVIAEAYQWHQLSKHEPRKQFKYYKQHGETYMYYSEEYLNKTPIKQLIIKDIRNAINLS